MHAKLHDLSPGRSDGKLLNPQGIKRKSWTHLPSSFYLIKTRKRKIKLQIHTACLFRSATPETKKPSSPRQINQTRVTNSEAVTHKICMVRCFSCAPGVQPKQKALHSPLYNKDHLFLSLRFCNVHICTSRDFLF